MRKDVCVCAVDLAMKERKNVPQTSSFLITFCLSFFIFASNVKSPRKSTGAYFEFFFFCGAVFNVTLWFTGPRLSSAQHWHTASVHWRHRNVCARFRVELRVCILWQFPQTLHPGTGVTQVRVGLALLGLPLRWKTYIGATAGRSGIKR